jgi:hypothetical protein
MNQPQIGVLEVLTALGAGGVITKVVDAIMRGRTPRKDYLEAVAQAADLLMKGMREDLDALRGEMHALKDAHAGELKAIREQHADCERRVAALQTQLAAVAPRPRRAPRKDT